MWPFPKNESTKPGFDTDDENDLENDIKYRIEINRNMVLKGLLPRHHYVFVHHVMRDICHEMPDVYFASIANDKTEFISKIWDATSEACGGSEETYFSPSDIKVHLVSIGNFPAVLTIMPLPLIYTEAYFVAAVLLVPTDSDSEITPDMNLQAAYITLERAVGPHGIEKYALCAWNGSTHINLGYELESLDVEKFVEAVEYILKSHPEQIFDKTEVKKWKDFHSNLHRRFSTGDLVANA